MLVTCKSVDELPLVLTVEQLIPILGVGRNAAYALVRSGRIRSVRIGHQYRIHKEALIEFLSDSGSVA